MPLPHHQVSPAPVTSRTATLPTASTAPITTASKRPMVRSRCSACAGIAQSGKPKRADRFRCPELLQRLVTICLRAAPHEPQTKCQPTLLRPRLPLRSGPSCTARPMLLVLIIGLGAAGIILIRGPGDGLGLRILGL